MKEKFAMPEPFSKNWREAYRHKETDLPRLSAYQAPNGSPMSFIYSTISVSGGQIVDTAEFPFQGCWSNNSLNEKPQSIKVNGFLRGLNYIEDRMNIIDALRIVSSDDEPGFLEIPTWGRFPVVVEDWSVDESGKENGQCAMSITFIRAGVSETKRTTGSGGDGTEAALSSASDKVKDAAAKSFEKALAKTIDKNALLEAFDTFKEELLNITGRVQGAQNFLNNITNEVQNIANLIAQVITAPKTLALALFGAVASIIASIMTIKNAVDEMSSSSSTEDKASQEKNFSTPIIKNNVKNALMQFLAAASFSLPGEPATEAERVTKVHAENLYKVCAFYATAQLLPALENSTYQQQQSLWTLFERLEQSITKEDVALYVAIEDVRIALSQTLIAKKAAVELSTQINSPMPLLALAQHLGCDEAHIRRLNRIENSFTIEESIKYV